MKMKVKRIGEIRVGATNKTIVSISCKGIIYTNNPVDSSWSIKVAPKISQNKVSSARLEKELNKIMADFLANENGNNDGH